MEGVTLRREGTVAWMVIDQPPLNLLSPDLVDGLMAAFDALELADDVRCVVLTGAGERAFSAGANLNGRPDRPGQDAISFREKGRALVARIEAFPKPVVSAIRGWCIGGGFALSQACDIRVASEDAKFRTGDAYIGVVPSWGVSLTRMVHYIGRNRALDLLMLGEDLSAAQAREMGLLTRVLPAASFDADVAAIAARLAGGAPLIFRAIKETTQLQYQESPAAAQEQETAYSDRARDSHDLREGIAALKEKRAPRFTGL